MEGSPKLPGPDSTDAIRGRFAQAAADDQFAQPLVQSRSQQFVVRPQANRILAAADRFANRLQLRIRDSVIGHDRRVEQHGIQPAQLQVQERLDLAAEGDNMLDV